MSAPTKTEMIAATRKKLDKDRFRRDLGEVCEACVEIDRRTSL